MISPVKYAKGKQVITPPALKAVFKSVLPVHICSLILGASPCTRRLGRLKVSYINLCYSVTLVTTTSIIRITIEEQEIKPTFFDSAVNVFNYLTPICTLISVIFMIFYSRKTVKILNGGLELTSYVTPVSLKHLFWKQIFLISFWIFASIASNILIGLFSHNFMSWNHVVLDFQLGLTLWMLRLQFIVLIDILTEILKVVPKKILALSTFDPPNAYLSLPGDLNTYISVYDKVIGLAEGMNSAYGFTLGVTFFLTTLQCTIIAYSYFVTREAGLPWATTSFAVTALFHEWIILWTVDSFYAQVKTINQVVYNTMRDCPIKQIKKQLQDFSVYLLHRKVQFTVCGLVSMDYSLLFTMAGSITTYMIILLQFEKTENSSGANESNDLLKSS